MNSCFADGQRTSGSICISPPFELLLEIVFLRTRENSDLCPAHPPPLSSPSFPDSSPKTPNVHGSAQPAVPTQPAHSQQYVNVQRTVKNFLYSLGNKPLYFPVICKVLKKNVIHRLVLQYSFLTYFYSFIFFCCYNRAHSTHRFLHHGTSW